MTKCLQHFFDTKTRRRKGTKFFNKTNLIIYEKYFQLPLGDLGGLTQRNDDEVLAAFF
jgi:hypothetical protein